MACRKMSGIAAAATSGEDVRRARGGRQGRRHYTGARPMRSRVIWRRSATALGVYVAAVLGFLTTVVATRELGVARLRASSPRSSPRPAFFQLLLDLTSRRRSSSTASATSRRERWGRLRRLFEVALGFKLVGGAARRRSRSARSRRSRRRSGASAACVVPMLIAALIAARPGARGRRRPARSSCAAATTSAARSSPSRWACAWSGSRSAAATASTGAVIGMVVAQVVATAAISRRRARRVPPLPAGALRAARRRRRGAAAASWSPRRSPRRSTRRAATLGTSLLPAVAPIDQAGYFRNAQAPATGLRGAVGARRGSCCSPSRRATSRRAGTTAMYAMLRRYIVGTAALMVVAVPVLWC